MSERERDLPLPSASIMQYNWCNMRSTLNVTVVGNVVPSLHNAAMPHVANENDDAVQCALINGHLSPTAFCVRLYADQRKKIAEAD